MKKITFIIVSLFLLIYLNSCAGYKPIFKAGNLNFKIDSHKISGDKKIGNEIYSKLYRFSQSSKNNSEMRSINLSIKVSKNKTATTKNSVGKILEYKINLNTSITINDFLTNDKILNQDFNYTSSYKVQDQHSETIKLENRTIKDLVNKTNENIIIKLSESFAEK